MTNPHYWCTWRTQNALSRQRFGEKTNPVLFEGDQGAKLARSVLNEEFLFGENGAAWQFPKFRDRLYFMLDDGWDVSYQTHPDTNRHLFSSLILDSERFPSFPGEPWERLACLNERLKQIGWRGLGIWVACQNFGEHAEGPNSSTEEIQTFWSERFKWCQKAGIEYMKVDWGARCEDANYRHEMTRLAHRFAPGLLVEHARPCRPINDVMRSNRFSHWEPVHTDFLKIAEFSDVFRIYDTAPQLSVSSTLDRCAVLLSELPNDSNTLLNCEDELYLGAGLGLCVAPMRSVLSKGDVPRKDPTAINSRITEIQRVLAWFSMSPAFSKQDSGQNSCLLSSSNLLEDSWYFEEGDFWWSELNGKTIVQAAPSVVSRDLPCPIVTSKDGLLPFVVSCRYPNGSTAISFLPRMVNGKLLYPEADTFLQAPFGTFGIFGRFSSLHIETNLPANCRIYARDLACTADVDVTESVTITKSSVTIPGELACRLCHNPEGDLSQPGICVTIR